MLNKKRSAGRARLRLLYVLPVTGIMLCASSLAFTKEYALLDLYALKNQSLASPVREASQQEKKYFFIKDSEKRLLVLNGKKLSRKGIITIEGFDKMVELNEKTATEKYGSSGANGAVEFAGKNTLATNKFPPPIVKLDAPKKDAPAKVIKFPPPTMKPKKHASAKIVKFPPPIVTKDVPPPPPPAPPTDEKLAPPPPPPVPPKSEDNARIVQKEQITYSYSVDEVKAVNAKTDQIKQVRINENKDKKSSTTFSYQISVKPEKAVEKVKSDVKEIRVDYAEKDKETAKPAKKD